jgi:hypothetical protein
MTDYAVKVALSLTEEECIEIIKALNAEFGRNGDPYVEATYKQVCKEYESYRNAIKGRPPAEKGEGK